MVNVPGVMNVLVLIGLQFRCWWDSGLANHCSDMHGVETGSVELCSKALDV